MDEDVISLSCSDESANSSCSPVPLFQIKPSPIPTQRLFPGEAVVVPLNHRYRVPVSQMDKIANVFSSAIHAMPVILGIHVARAPIIGLHGRPDPERLDEINTTIILPLPSIPSLTPTMPRVMAVTDDLRYHSSSDTFNPNKLIDSPLGRVSLNAKRMQIRDFAHIRTLVSELGHEGRPWAICERDLLVVLSWMREVGYLLQQNWRTADIHHEVIYFDADGMYRAVMLFLRLMSTPTFVFTAPSVPAIAAVCISIHCKMLSTNKDCHGAPVPPELDGVLAYLTQIPTSELLFVEKFVLCCICDDPGDQDMPSLEKMWLEMIAPHAHHLNDPFFDHDLHWRRFDTLVMDEILPSWPWYNSFVLMDPSTTTATTQMKKDLARLQLVCGSQETILTTHTLTLSRIMSDCIQKMNDDKRTHDLAKQHDLLMSQSTDAPFHEVDHMLNGNYVGAL